MGDCERENSWKFKTHERYHESVHSGSIADLLVLENVPEYNMKEFCSRYLGSGWGCITTVIDPRLLGFGNSRARVYGLVWKKSVLKPDPKYDLMAIIEAVKARPMMNAMSFYYLKLDTSTLSESCVPQLRLAVYSPHVVK